MASSNKRRFFLSYPLSAQSSRSESMSIARGEKGMLKRLCKKVREIKDASFFFVHRGHVKPSRLNGGGEAKGFAFLHSLLFRRTRSFLNQQMKCVSIARAVKLLFFKELKENKARNGRALDSK